MTGKEKSAVCNAVARGIVRCWEILDEPTREAVTIEIGEELVQLLGAGFDGERMLVAVDVIRMTA